MPPTRKDWHQHKPAQALLASLTEQDLRIVRAHDNMGNCVMAFESATEHGARVLDRLNALCYKGPNRMLRAAQTDEGRAVVLAWAQRRTTVAGALASRFGDPERFRGHRTEDGSATRVFRATFADKTEWAS